MLCPEAIGSKSAELIRILLYTHSLTHSITQREGIVASPPIGCSSHKNICNGKLQNRSKAQGLVKVILKKKGKQKENEIKIPREMPASGFELGIPECEEIVAPPG